MPLEIPRDVEHYLGRFRGTAGKEFELAVAQAPGSELMGCNAFLDFGIGSDDKDSTDKDFMSIFELRSKNFRDCSQYIAELTPGISPSLFVGTVWSAIHGALMDAQRTRVNGMWINLSDGVVDHLGLNGPGERPTFFEGIVDGVKTYWLGVCSKKPDEHIGSVVIGAGVGMYDILGGASRIASIVNPFMTSRGVLKLV